MGDRQQKVQPKFITEGSRVVVVLGAGATISEMGHERKPKLLPPTDQDFLKAAAKCDRRAYRELEKLFKELWNGGEPYPMKEQRMEQLFASTFLRVQVTHGTSKAGQAARRLYDQLILLLRHTLAKTTGKAEPREHISLLSRIADRGPRSLDLITFNYDVIADRALLTGCREGLWDWNHRDGYGFSPNNCTPPKKASTVQLLKLHGSMNWYIDNPSARRRTAYSYRAPIYVPLPSARRGTVAWQNQQKKVRKQKVFPLLLPPVFEKATHIGGVLGSVWERAQDVLAEADLVIVWGYSLPPTDYHAEMLFARGARVSESNLIIVNPDKSALSRVTEVCGHRWTRWFFSMDDLFKVDHL